MNRLFLIIFLSLFLQGCDDGDVIVTDLDFDNVALKTCGSLGNYIFYKENTEVFQSLSLRLGTSDSLYKTEGTKTYTLSGTTNFVNYRSYDGPLGNNYFCSSIPPTSPIIEADYLAVSGSAQVIVSFNEDETPIVKNVQIILKDLVLINGDKQIIQETLDMGIIENVQPF